MRLGVTDERDDPRDLASADDVGDRKRVGGDEHGFLRPLEHELESAGVARDDLAPRLSALRRLVRAVFVRPFAVGGKGPALEGPVVRIVQLRDDEPRYVPLRERQVGGLARALELGDDTEVDRVAGERPSELACFLPSGRAERNRGGRISVDEPLGAVFALAVARQDDPTKSQKSRLR